jgi:hypothetical protein
MPNGPYRSSTLHLQMHHHQRGDEVSFRGEHLCAYRNLMRSVRMLKELKLNQMGVRGIDMTFR